MFLHSFLPGSRLILKWWHTDLTANYFLQNEKKWPWASWLLPILQFMVVPKTRVSRVAIVFDLVAALISKPNSMEWFPISKKKGNSKLKDSQAGPRKFRKTQNQTKVWNWSLKSASAVWWHPQISDEERLVSLWRREPWTELQNDWCLMKFGFQTTLAIVL